MSLGPALLRPFDGPHRTALKTTWQQAMAAAPGLWPDEVACLRAALDSNAAASVQSTFAVHQAQAAYDHLLRGLDGNTTNGQIAQAWLRSVASPCALHDSRHSQPPTASPSPTPSSVGHSAEASDCAPCPAAPPPFPAFAARPWPPPTRSMPTRAPPPMRFACCATMNLLKLCAARCVGVGSHPPKSRSSPPWSPAPTSAYPAPKPEETSSTCSQTSSRWGTFQPSTRARHGTAGLPPPPPRLPPPRGTPRSGRSTDRMSGVHTASRPSP
jgi:hypothetical protein